MNTRDIKPTEQRSSPAGARRTGRTPAACPPGDPTVDAYRLVIRAVRQPRRCRSCRPISPGGSPRVSPAGSEASLEDWHDDLLVLGMALGGGGYFLPRFWPVYPSVNLPAMNFPSVSWPLLVAAAAGIGIAWAIDRVCRTSTTAAA